MEGFVDYDYSTYVLCHPKWITVLPTQCYWQCLSLPSSRLFHSYWGYADLVSIPQYYYYVGITIYTCYPRATRMFSGRQGPKLLPVGRQGRVRLERVLDEGQLPVLLWHHELLWYVLNITSHEASAAMP